MTSRASSLLRGSWDTPEAGRVVAVRPTAEILQAADAAWPPGRRATDAHHTWSWVAIMATQKDRFALLDDNGQPLAFFASSRNHPVALPSGKFYRLDYLEIAPSLRGGTFGVFALAVVAVRALELEAEGVVLTAFRVDGLVGFYQRTGATVGAPRGWNYPKELVALTFERIALEPLRELADELREDQEA